MIEAIRETFLGGAPMAASVAVKVLQMFRVQSNETKKEFFDLSEREKEILSLLVKGKSYKAIASECFISYIVWDLLHLGYADQEKCCRTQATSFTGNNSDNGCSC